MVLLRASRYTPLPTKGIGPFKIVQKITVNRCALGRGLLI